MELSMRYSSLTFRLEEHGDSKHFHNCFRTITFPYSSGLNFKLLILINGKSLKFVSIFLENYPIFESTLISKRAVVCNCISKLTMWLGYYSARKKGYVMKIVDIKFTKKRLIMKKKNHPA